MIDFGLLVSMIVAVGLPTLVANRWPLRSYDPPVDAQVDAQADTQADTQVKVLDVALVPIGVGLAVGRLSAVALDDPRSLTRLADLMIIRSGVELWPGVVAAAIVVAVQARREGVAPLVRLADAAPLVLLAYAGYEAACPVRDGCFGPASPVGLTPPGLTTTMLPVGILMGLVVALGAVALHRAAEEPAPVRLAGAVAVVAVTRAVGSFWLPHVGTGLTRQHQTSIVVAVGSTVLLVALLRLGQHRRVRGRPVREDI